MSDRNLIEELEARAEHVDTWKLVLGVVLLVFPPTALVGLVVLAYLFYKAGERLDGIDEASEEATAHEES